MMGNVLLNPLLLGDPDDIWAIVRRITDRRPRVGDLETYTAHVLARRLRCEIDEKTCTLAINAARIRVRAARRAGLSQ